MRELTGHKVNGCNEAIKIEVLDEPGSGGACHRYEITGFDTAGNPSATKSDGYKSSFARLPILFQNGPIKESGVNGVTHEALLAILVDRLQAFQHGPFANDYNQEALNHLQLAQVALLNRTQERVARGVEGTREK